ncbi:MAG: alpha-E domain-containing protein [Planctomycetota bacterium]|jgi:uncharacterized alpha-E superfamily protein|nr:alpha-E domain-containing protein [Planctomycetota bacterium]
MLTRLAGNTYWLARSLERAENTCRLLRALNRQSLLPGAVHTSALFRTALAVVDELEAFQVGTREQTARAILEYILIAPENHSSVVNCFANVRENGRSARHMLTASMWEAVNRTYLRAQEIRSEGVRLDEVDEVIDWALQGCYWIRGAADELRRDGLPHVLSLGQALERLDFTLRLLSTLLADLPSIDPDNPPTMSSGEYRRWLAMIEAGDMSESWRSSSPRRRLGQTALAMFVTDPHTTRSLVTNARRVVAALEIISGRDDSAAMAAASALVHQILAIPIGDGDLSVVQTAITEVVIRTWELSDLCIRDHLSIAQPATASASASQSSSTLPPGAQV